MNVHHADRQHARRAIAAWSLAGLTLVGLSTTSLLAAETVEITVIDVRQGDSILISFPPGASGKRKHMLIDGGPSRSDENAVVQTLRGKNIDTLDFVVLTHPHIDHYAGLIPVLNDFTVKEFWWTGEARGESRGETLSDSSPWRLFEQAMTRAEEIVQVEVGDERSSQDAEVEILNAGGEYPDTTRGKNINNDSIVMMLRYRRVKVLFTGDIEEEEGLDLVDEFCARARKKCKKLNSDIIKIPHHGSAHLSSQFVKFAAAEHVLISAGHKNKQFHHPRESALRAYEEFGAERFFSTSDEAKTDIVVVIGPDRDQISIDGPETGFTSWRELHETEEDDTEDCDTEIHKGFCLITH